ncbi:MAG: hypothetical protein IJ529_00915 [Alphaproteobacteria bacterium]|nr:hypothetical protein [Alphaproteobacteria bacterium]MBQ9234853.1 hypothetical protein [Alphaproteobacteria bacterium]
MIGQLRYGCVAAAMMIVAACSAGRKNLSAELLTNETVFNGSVEKLPARVSPYTSIARAAKYNADTAAQNTFRKVYHSDEKPREIIKGLFEVNDGDDKLYHALRALDFADIYALSVLTDNSHFIENNIYAKSAQNLSAAAIKMHRREIYAGTTLREIDRLSKSNEKVLATLRQKYDREGFLTEPEINYRKSIEVALNHLEKLKSELLLNRGEYMRLIKAKEDGVRLEGKRFYELEDFDKKYTPELFQETAVINRREFALAREELGTYNATKAGRKAYIDYPPVARLDINGLTIDDMRYEDALYNKAQIVADNLMDRLEKAQSVVGGESAKQKAFDELCALVMTQVEVSYHLVKKATFAYESNLYKINELKAVIKALEKKSNLADYEKADLLEQKVRLLELENTNIENLSQRAAALRSLYFYAGLSPFDKTTLKEPISDLEVILKRAFNNDIVTMLTNAKAKERWDDGGNSWAHKDNWLDQLIDDPLPNNNADFTDDEPPVSEVKPSVDVASQEVIGPKTTASKAPTMTGSPKVVTQGVSDLSDKTMIQLGAYSDVENAMDDQSEILAKLPQLKKYDIFFENAVVGGNSYQRMLLKPEKDKLLELCNAITDAGFECLLR